ncbi:MAG: multi-sensor signal transduction histidine kinase [Parcubacteria group bacterium Gr01-1014_38]|nr:MAG: multi-sensor signal transduction histidine kinase [Parcubacteria group bacterium Gr01-1014_38]
MTPTPGSTTTRATDEPPPTAAPPEADSVSSEKFVTLTAHEMQVPISVLSWNMGRLNRVLGTVSERPDVRRILDRLLEANVRLTTLVEDLLNLAKLHEGAFRVYLRPIQLTEVARRCLKTLEREAERRGVVLTWSWDQAQIPLTRGDPNRLSEVITNLVSNGVKYTPRGGRVAISIRSSSELAPPTVPIPAGKTRTGKYLLVSVEDTGMGIPNDEQPKVFQQFFRGRKAFASAEGGTGLGLYLVRRMVEQHGGAVWFVSREGYGSTFFFTLPVAEPYPEGAEATKSA